MRVSNLSWTSGGGWSCAPGNCHDANLVIYFGSRQALESGERYAELKDAFPSAHVLGCSTGGQIHNDDISDDEIGALAIRFGATRLKAVCREIGSAEHSAACGQEIGQALAAPDLSGVFVLSDGLNVNGSALVAGLTGAIGNRIPVTGGLAGDGAAFQSTLVGCDEPPRPRRIAAIGFYGSAIRIGHGSAGGWDVFGPHRRITRSSGNVLHELDGEPALDLYERYLGPEDAQGLPGTGLLFPLRIASPEQPRNGLVRTILAVDRETRSMTFAGDMPEGWVAQLMRGHFDRLVQGAADAAQGAASSLNGTGATGAAILVSCIGRRLLMGQHALEEVEAAAERLGNNVSRIGFYSYGEISPHAASGMCELHNQTMTATVFSEAGA
ncbi:MAG: FIST signal transduction protein [Hyphomicrobiales bacterium]